ncbi:MAG TPA: hypothetical protein VJ841_00030 [Candidatus Saccharimonadales bacterium]|nr:hypothetical protein [Candidatus Saccharimonadales bacterium]
MVGINLPGTALRQASLSDPGHSALSRRDLVRLAASKRECIVRVTGGAAHMGTEGKNVGRLLAKALGGSKADAAVIAGATMSIDRPVQGVCSECDTHRVHCPAHGYGSITPRPGVMDVLMELSRMKAPARTIGIVPTIGDLSLYGGFIVVSNESEGTYTVVDGRCPFCLLLQFSTDKPGLTWDDEWKVSLDYMELLRNEAQYASLHIAYNGGAVTRNECLHVATLPQGDNPWKLLLVEDSGRTAAALSADREFRANRPHVVSCKKRELRTVVRQLGFAP